MFNEPAQQPPYFVQQPRAARLGESRPAGLAPSSPLTWHDAEKSAVFTPNCVCPPSLNGVNMASVPNASQAPGLWWRWADLQSQREVFQGEGVTRRGRYGVVVQETDGRVWLSMPQDACNGAWYTLPKVLVAGKASTASCIQEQTYEQTGLMVNVHAWLATPEDGELNGLFLTRRVAGRPSAMGHSSNAVILSTVRHLPLLLGSADGARIEHMLAHAQIPTWRHRLLARWRSLAAR